MKITFKLAACAGAWIAASQFLAGAATPPTTDLSLWLQADAGVTLNGATVSEWADQSGLGHNAYQSTDTSQPTLVTTAYGKPGLRFDGLNDFLRFTNNINELFGLTVFLVANNRSPAQTGGTAYSDSPAIFWNETASWGWVFLSPFQTNVNWRIGSTIANNNERYARPASIGASYSLTTLLKNSEVETLYVDGSLARTVSGKAFTTFGVREDGYLGRGSSTYFAGDILEVLVYNAALSETDRQTVETYLHDKYFSNPLPTVAITSPANLALFSAPANITITADATDNSSVTNVEFFVNGASIGSDTTVPYSVDWNSVPGGAYALTVKATDDQGAWAISSDVIVRVNYATPQEGPPLSGLGLWFKSDAGVTSVAGRVTAWADQSGFGSHAVQASVSAQPTLATGGNGKPAVSFDGVTNCLRFVSVPLDGLSALTIALVANNTSPQATGSGGEGSAALFWHESAGWGALSVGAFQDSANWRIGTTVSQASSPNYPGPAHVRPASIQRDYTRMTVVKDGENETLYTNGVLATTVSGKAPLTAGIDRFNGVLGYGVAYPQPTHFRGEIQEVLLYTNALSAADVANLDTYLVTKYRPTAQPTVAITSPADKTAFTAPSSITITANPMDSDGSISTVEFYDSGNLLGTATNAPWQCTFSAGPGSHTLTAKATDNEGLFNYSAPVLIFGNAASGFTLIEDFENRTLAPVIYQGDWTGLFQHDRVVDDTTTFEGGRTNNKTLLLIRNNQALSFPLLVPQGTTGTLFFRAASTTWSREEITIGLSDKIVPGYAVSGDFEPEIVRSTGASLANKMIGVRDGGVSYASLANFLSDVWYKIWLVADNSADTWKLYIQGGEYPTPTPVVNGTTSTFAFRNGVANNDLIRFLLRIAGTSRSVGGFWLDDIYLAAGENLSDPTLPAPPTLSIRKDGDNVIISWPDSATGYTLEATANLTTPSWSDVTEQQVPVDNQITVTVPVNQAPKYLRLKK